MLEAAIAAAFGLLIGSFLNVCVHRLPRDESVVHPRSHCPACQNPIAWYDNIPLLSYAVLGGRCRRCRAGISWRYPLVEFLTGVLFFSGVLLLGPTLTAIRFCVFAAIQIALIFTDLEERILPDEFTLGGTLAGLGFAALIPPDAATFALLFPPDLPWRLGGVLESACSAAVMAGVLWGIGELYARVRHRQGLGFGDVKMVGCIAAFLGFSPALMVVAGGSVLGSVVGIAWIHVAGKDAKSFELPFGSFLGVAAIIVALLSPLQSGM